VVSQATSGEDEEVRHSGFTEPVERLQDMVFGCAYARLGNFHLARDASQDAFMAAYRDLRSLNNPQAFAGWLMRIVVGRCDGIIRTRRVKVRPLDEVDQTSILGDI
jgi:DNA-directed RNA polymerase specialized sigma24 family protein